MGRGGAAAVQEHDAAMMLGMPGGCSVVSAGCHVDTEAGGLSLRRPLQSLNLYNNR